MSEIYWLTRLDSFNIFCGLILTADEVLKEERKRQ